MIREYHNAHAAVAAASASAEIENQAFEVWAHPEGGEFYVVPSLNSLRVMSAGRLDECTLFGKVLSGVWESN